MTPRNDPTIDQAQDHLASRDGHAGSDGMGLQAAASSVFTPELHAAAILESITDAFFAVDNQWCLTYLNSQAEKLLMRKREDLLGRNLWDEFPDALKRRFYREYLDAKRHNTAVHFEDYYEPLDMWLEVHAYPSKEGLSVYFQRINDRKEAEAMLRQTEDRLRLALTSAATGTWDFKPGTGELIWDDRTRKIMGVEPDQPIDYETFLSAVHPADRDRVDSAVAIALQSTADFVDEFRVMCHDGSVRWISTHGRTYFEQSDAEAGTRRPSRFIGTVADITERKKTEAHLREQAEKLARSNADLQQFAHVVSHDLQEPLRTVNAFSEIICRRYADKLDPEGAEILRHIGSGAQRMQQLIDALLSFSQVMNINTGFSTLVSLEDVLALSKANLEHTIVETNCQIDSGPLPVVKGDRVLLAQLLQNLIGNAIKYRREEPPRVAIRAQSSGASWLISIADNGLGIDPVQSSRIFGVFARLHGAEIPGTGMGLAICQRIVEHHGGRIWVEGEPGKGSTFYFTLAN